MESLTPWPREVPVPCETPAVVINGRNADPAVVAEKMARIRDTHVASLNALADRIADSLGLPYGYVPYVDPDQGGVQARVLVLLDNPSKKAEAGTGSGLLSLDNNDWTARACRETYAAAGIDWSAVVHWNVCPFPTASSTGTSLASERARATRWTRDFVALCPNLEMVLRLGRAAEDGWRRAGISRDLYVFPEGIPHCSRQGLATQAARTRFRDAIARMKSMLDAA